MSKSILTLTQMDINVINISGGERQIRGQTSSAISDDAVTVISTSSAMRQVTLPLYESVVGDAAENDSNQESISIRNPPAARSSVWKRCSRWCTRRSEKAIKVWTSIRDSQPGQCVFCLYQIGYVAYATYKVIRFVFELVL